MLLLIGLPKTGKTEWALKYKKENPFRNYYILGLTNILDKMKVCLLVYMFLVE
jgi:hypothetical protein